MATLMANHNFSLNDINDVAQAFTYAALNTTQRFCQSLRDYLAHERGWKIYRFIVVEQVNWEDDFAINGLSTHAVWRYNNKFYSVIWLV